MREPKPATAHQFADLDQQHDAAWTGMWIFLITEIMFFSGLFLLYLVYRTLYPAAFHEGSRHLQSWLGAVNTAVLICSSLTMAFAVHSAQTGRRGLLVLFLFLTMAVGAAFLAIKFHEYADHFRNHEAPGPGFVFAGADPLHAQLFFILYFLMTGLHAVHMIIGEGILATLLVLSALGRYTPQHHMPVELAGLYWHFVDIIWIFLFPLLYLIG